MWSGTIVSKGSQLCKSSEYLLDIFDGFDFHRAYDCSKWFRNKDRANFGLQLASIMGL